MYSTTFPRIYVVDDEHLVAATLARLLQMNGFSVRFVASPLEALEAARLDTPDLLICDVEMSGFCGVDLAARLKARHPSCRALLISGNAVDMDSVRDFRQNVTVSASPQTRSRISTLL